MRDISFERSYRSHARLRRQSRTFSMRKARLASDGDRRAIIADFTQADFDRLNRLAHARNLRNIVSCTKWLNYHGIELMARYPQEFRKGTGMTVQQYLLALSVHVDCCRTFLKRVEERGSVNPDVILTPQASTRGGARALRTAARIRTA
jgi:hypothetical protein